MPPVGSIRLQCFIHRKNVKVHCGTIKTNFISICTLAVYVGTRHNEIFLYIRFAYYLWVDLIDSIIIYRHNGSECVVGICNTCDEMYAAVGEVFIIICYRKAFFVIFDSVDVSILCLGAYINRYSLYIWYRQFIDLLGLGIQ